MPVIHPPGYDYLGAYEFASSAASSAVLAIAARDLLLVQVHVTGYGGTDIASLRFNGDTGTNYTSRYISYAAGGTTAANNQNVSQTMARMFALGVTVQRSALIGITNRAAQPKVGTVNGQTAVSSAATGLQIEFGGFQWQNTSAQITSMQMLCPGGQTLSAGTCIAVFGKNC